MAFTIRPYRRFLPSVSCSGFGLLITLLSLSHESLYAEWVSVGEKVEERLTEYTIYIDPDTIRRNGDMVELWALLDFKALQTEPSPPYLSVKAHRQFNCTEERVRLLAMSAFSGHMGSGKVVFSYSDSNDLGIPVEPSSVAESLWKVVCAKP